MNSFFEKKLLFILSMWKLTLGYEWPYMSIEDLTKLQITSKKKR